MKRYFQRVTVLVACAAWSVLPAPGGEETAIWQQYVTGHASGRASPLPDYSYAGYAFGERAISDVAGPIFDVTGYGAAADDDASDREGIQAAIRAAEKRGGGVVFFPPGRFLLNEQPGLNRGIEIRGSGIVLRGSGAGKGGTTLFMREMLLPTDPGKLWTVPAIFYFTPLERELSSREIQDSKGQPHTMLVDDASEGSRRIVVADASGFGVGDVVSVAHESTALNSVLLRGLSTRDLWERINTRGIACTEKHVIRGIEGNVLLFHAPVRMDLKAELGWKVLRYPVLENCGFEDLHVAGNFLEPYVHHKNAMHDSGFSGVVMEACFNSWIRRCRFTNLSMGPSLRGCLASSMLMNVTGGNPGHGCFNISFGTHNLLGLSRDDTGYFHGPNVSHLAVGSVVWRFRADTPRGGPDFHATFPRTTLWDASACRSRDSHGGNYKDLPNHLGGLTFWNFQHLGAAEQAVNFWDLLPDSPKASYGPLTAVKPLIVGFHGSDTTFDERSLSGLHSLGLPVLPASLYEAQLKLRLGTLPDWVEAAKHEWAAVAEE